ncbi:MAG TPA: hypothetical protein V6D29_00330 [Leptolyngbyaceae cyanobacterium]
MSDFRYLKSNCPICEGARRDKDCRQSIRTGAVHCRAVDVNPTGWQPTGCDAHGFRIWVESANAVNPDYWAEQEIRRQQQQQLQAEQRKKLLSATERDRQFRQVAKLSGLAIRHRQALEVRCRQAEVSTVLVNRWIEQRLVFSWQPGQIFPGVTAALPGTNQHGGLRNYQGYAFGVPDSQGRVLGYQVKPEHGSGWFWAASQDPGPSIYLQNGEVPLGVYRPSKLKSTNRIGLAEGFAKPAIASERLGMVFIGAAGGNFASSPEQFKEAIETLLAEMPGAELVLYPDAGMLDSNHQNVQSAWRQTAKLCKELGYPLQIAWWGQTEKAHGDVDEAPTATIEAAKLISTSKLESLVKKAQPSKVREWLDQVAELAGAPKGADRATIAVAFDQQHKLSGDAPMGIFPELSLPEQGRNLFVLDGQKMTRKTSSSLHSIIAEAQKRGMAGYVLVPTRVLAREFVGKAKAKGLYICTIEQWQSTPENQRHYPMWVVGCPESAWKVDSGIPGDGFDLILIDECNEVIERAQSGELGNRPEASRRALKKMLKDASIVVIAQDGLYRPILQAVQRWGEFEPTEVEVIRRRRAATNITIKLYLDRITNEAFYSWFDDIVEARQAGQKVVIPCGSEGKCRAIHRALKSIFPEGRGQVIDGKYTPARIRAEFADNPSQFASNHQLDWLIYSPVFNSGVSEESTYFDASFEYVRAFETASSASQRGERIRDAIQGQKITTRHVYIAARGLPKMPDPAVFTAGYWRQLLFAPDERPEAFNLAKQMGCTHLLERIGEHQQRTLEDCLELPMLLAIRARELYFKEELLIQEWQGNGWSVVSIPGSPEAAKRWSEEFYWVGEGLISQKARTLAKARPVKQLGDEAYGPIEATKNLKYELTQLIGEHYPGLRDSEWLESWVIASGESGLPELRIRSLVRMFHEQPDLWEALSRMMALAHITKGSDIHEEPLPCSQREFAIANLLKDAPGIYEVIETPDMTWTSDSHAVKAAKAWALVNAQALARLSSHQQRIHGFQFTAKTSGVRCLHKLLSMVGLKGQCLGKQSTGRRLYEYRLLTSSDLETKIQAQLSRGNEKVHSLQRQSHRLNTDSEVYEALERVLCDRVAYLAPQWEKVAAQILEKYAVQNFSKDKDLITEVLDETVLPTPNDLADLRQMRAEAEAIGPEAVEALKTCFSPPVWATLSG